LINKQRLQQMSPSFISVPYIDMAGQHAAIKTELMEAVGAVLSHGKFVLGEEVETFEKDFAKLCRVRFAIGVNSGTDALVLALRALGIGPGDEVITVPNSFVASTSCIRLVGAKPVFVDVRDDYNLDPGQLERAITRNTKVILPIHLTGRPADMKPIMDIAQSCDLHVIEDCAQAVMAEYNSQCVGSFGTFGCFSLHPLKTLNACGDGGVLTTNDESLCEKLKVLRNLGLRTRDDCVEWSGNSRLDTLQAAILLVKMKYLQAWTEKRRAHAAFYQTALKNMVEVHAPADQPHEKSVYHTFVVQADNRDELKACLLKHGVETAIHYPVPVHFHKAAANLGCKPGSFPVAERQAARILSLPVHQGLAPDQLAHVIQVIKAFYKK
jgi:dTDP-4-amino-4,6-dideoxygalactose transaminase